MDGKNIVQNAYIKLDTDGWASMETDELLVVIGMP